MSLQSPRFAGDATLEACLAGTRRLTHGERGEPIKKIQQALNDLGFSMPITFASGAPDGGFGLETETAVVAFKADWHLTPGDPVVGPKTMAALDREMLALDRPAPVPIPAPPPPVPPDVFGRTAAGLAKVPRSLATATAFGATGAGSSWLHLNRSIVAGGIAERVSNPDGAQQGGNGLCTTAAFINIWAQDAPDAYAAFATTLFDNGAANIAPNQAGGGLRIAASPALLGADYDAIATQMAAAGFPVPSQADWMVMSAIRDSTNRVFKFTGDRDDWVSHNLGDGALPIGDLDAWLRNAGAWVSVVDLSNVLLTASVDEAQHLEPIRSRCLLNIDVGMLLAATGRHTVVLRSPVTETGDGFVTFKVWSWAGIRDVRITKVKFESTYFGANVAFV